MEAGGFQEDHPTPIAAGVDLLDPDIELARTPWQLFWRRFRDDKLAMASLIFIVLLILMAIFAPVVVKIFGAPTDYDYRDTAALDPLFATATGPSADHIFGVDQLGRDVFTRIVYGARVSLVVAFTSTILATVLGVAAGLIAGYYRGWSRHPHLAVDRGSACDPVPAARDRARGGVHSRRRRVPRRR